MRIIQIIDVRWYNACADFAIKQALGLSALGHDLLLMANPGSPPALKAREAGLMVDESIDFSKSMRFAGAVKRLRRTIAAHDADIVLAHRGESHLIGALACRNGRCKIARFRGDVRAARSNLFSRWLNEKMTDGISVSSELLKADYERKFSLDGVPLRVIYPGIDTDKFVPKSSKDTLRRKFDLPTDRLTIGMVGRLSPVKGHRYFIEAARLVAARYPQTQFVIAGGDAQISSTELQIMARLLRLDNIRFYGIVDDVAELVGAFDVGVVASIGSEMICRVLLEYFAAGLPVVAAAVNQISELMLLSKGGIMVPLSDPVAMSQAMIRLIESPDMRAGLAASGREWVFGRNLRALGNDTQAFLQEVVNV